DPAPLLDDLVGGGEEQGGEARTDQRRPFHYRTHWPSRATTRPPLTTQARDGRATTISASVSPGTTTKLSRQPAWRPQPSRPRTASPPWVTVSSLMCSTSSFL